VIEKQHEIDRRHQMAGCFVRLPPCSKRRRTGLQCRGNPAHLQRTTRNRAKLRLLRGRPDRQGAVPEAAAAALRRWACGAVGFTADLASHRACQTHRSGGAPHAAGLGRQTHPPPERLHDDLEFKGVIVTVEKLYSNTPKPNKFYSITGPRPQTRRDWQAPPIGPGALCLPA
jgi:hypothetical protein